MPTRRRVLARLCGAVACVGLLAGCASEAERQAAAEAQAAADRRECLDLGFEEGSEPYANCLLKLREIRAMDMQGSGIGLGVGVGFGF